MFERLWSRAPRRLRFTGSGRAIVGIALASGLAAINTGNNLLFLGWGLVLSAISLSGVLSELNLRYLRADAGVPRDARVGEVLQLTIAVQNGARRWKVFALEIVAHFDALDAHAPYLMQLGGASQVEILAPLVPLRRGLHTLRALDLTTHFPFGFFAKSRVLRPRVPVRFWAAPPRVNVDTLALQLSARMGETPAHRVGWGDEFFSLRPFQPGDDPRRVHWRRSARTGHLVCKEHEAQEARAVLLELQVRGAFEPPLAVLGSLAERLLESGHRVGVRTHGAYVSVAQGPRQQGAILHALARADAAAPLPAVDLGPQVLRVALAGAGLEPPTGATLELPI
jgi:uncharacterized protein (DUF58 family)